MRARYAAFARAEVDFLLVTGTDTDREGLLAWCRRARFVRLEVQSTEAGGREDDAGFVTFAARFLEAGKAFELRERSRFGRVDGRWRYLDGDTAMAPLPSGRNGPCPCGSGEKLKRCHG